MSESFQVDHIGFHYGYVVAAIACIILMTAWGVYYSYGVFFKPLIEEFGWTRAMTSSAFSMGTIVQGLVAIVAGRLTDRFGARPLVISGGILTGAGYILMWQINSIWQLYVFYGLLTGLGMGCFFVPLMSDTAHWFKHNRGLMTGIVVAGIGLGAIIVPPLASSIIDSYDWRISFVILGIAVLATSVLLGLFLKPCSAAGKNSGNTAKQGSPVLPGISLSSALHTRQLWMTCGLFFCLGFCLFSVMVHIAPHTTDIGFTASDGAAIIAVIGLSSILAKIGMGYIADRIGSRPGWMIGFGIMAVTMIWIIWTTELWALYTFAALFGFTYGGLVVNESPLVANMFGLRSHGAIFGIASFSFTIGASLGPLQTGAIYDLTLSYQTAFIIIGIMAVIGLVTALMIRPIKKTLE